jgi:AcrR family transcriptional regulator
MPFEEYGYSVNRIVGVTYFYRIKALSVAQGTKVARHPDPDLEDRILKAARKLWKKGAEKALTMRAVARAAGTNTPALYRRFRSRDDILRALLEQSRQEVFQHARESTSVEDFCERYVTYAISHPHEYKLFYLKEFELFHAGKKADGPLKETLRQKRPIVQFMTGKLAAQLPGVSDDKRFRR